MPDHVLMDTTDVQFTDKWLAQRDPNIKALLRAGTGMPT